ncbi:hypothetical protein JCM21714_4227 [Gracilibacillus boraciitolerans JCM 21714]|uniref:Uncharacterized protein n=1 Tax=Gracilibacillus boraciitolerans JCM 21714 TaxID=1298598 RepID=W4VQI3_9BACI|nr:LacI family DNA-binding transcriptional regulator [Gracilibacillus boraciitolerans]GAE95024.1 hypothetical protein JCM21714_4227 [Gracilibacillus boraciitolerans JCM 21714]
MVTIKEIAKRAGVSLATVSHVVNRTRYVSPELVKKVEDVINSLDELPNFIAKKRELSKTSESGFIQIFATNPLNTFQANVLKSIIREVSYTNVVTIHSKDLYEILRNYSFLDSDKCKGQIILIEEKIKSPPIKFHSSLKMLPTVIISESNIQSINSNASVIRTVISDSYNGSYNAVNHLVRNGHNKIALIHEYILNGNDTYYNGEILTGYKDALLDNGIQIDNRYVSEIVNGENALVEYLHNLLYGENPPTALFVINEDVLSVVFKFLNSNNLACPEDISIISYYDTEWYELFSPAVSAVQQDIYMIGKKAIEYIEESSISSHLNIENSNISTVIPTKLHIRSSTSGISRGPFGGEKAAKVDVLNLSENEKLLFSKRKYTAAISFHYTGAAWMELHQLGIKDVFNELGISLLAVTDAHFDPEMQSKQLDSIMAFDPDIIIAISTEDNKTSEAFKRVAKSPSKLVLITNVPRGLTQSDYVSCVSVNEWTHGRLAGSELGNSMRKYNRRNVGFISYDSNFYATNQRDMGAHQILLEEYPDLNIVKEVKFKKEEDVYEDTIQLLKKYPEIQGLYISWEGPATKVLEAVNSIGRKDIIIVTSDLDYSLALNMAEGGNVKAVSAQLPYEQGQAIALVAANALLNKDVPKFIGVEPIKVTCENLLKSWKRIFKRTPPKSIIEAIKNNSYSK